MPVLGRGQIVPRPPQLPPQPLAVAVDCSPLRVGVEEMGVGGSEVKDVFY